MGLCVHINKHIPFFGGTYYDLPNCIKVKKAVVNVFSNINECFYVAVVSALFPAKINVNRLSSYPHFSEKFNLKNCKIPMDIKRIPIFEKNNKLRINVYGYFSSKKETFDILPLYISKYSYSKRINLLMIKYDLNVYHYCWIKNMSRLIRSNVTRRTTKIWICDRCLFYVYNEAKFNEHFRDCGNFNAVKSILPNETDKWLNFKNFSYKEKIPFIVYADTESILCPMNETNDNKKTKECFQHEASSIAFYLKCSFDSNLDKFELYRGKDCTKWFSKKMCEIAKYVLKIYINPKPMEPLNGQEKKNSITRKFATFVKNHLNEILMNYE